MVSNLKSGAARGWRAAGAVLSVAVALAGCGGGGGGSGGEPSPSGFSVTLDRSSIDVTFDEGSLPAAMKVVATASGTVPNPLFVGAVVEGDALDPNIPAVLTASSAQFSILPRMGLAPGSYTGRVMLLACADSACKQTLGGTPLPVSYRVTVRPAFKVSPQSVRQRATGGQASSATVQVQLPAGVDSFTVSPPQDAPWLELGTPSAGGQPLVFKSWRSGTYATQLEIRAGDKTAYVAVNYTVEMPPGGERELAAQPATMSFVSTEGAGSPPQTLTLVLPSWDASEPVPTVDYASDGSNAWLSFRRTAAGLELTADAGNLAAGAYGATVVITPRLPAQPVRVPVSLTVGPGLLAIPAASMLVDAQTTADLKPLLVAVQVAGGAAQRFTASADASWLRVLTPTGVTGDTLGLGLDQAAVAELPNFASYTTEVTVRSVLSNVTPISFTVSLDKRLPEVHGVGPYVAISGQTQRVHVRGRGFSPAGDPVSRLSIGSLSLSNVERISDSEMVATVTPSSAGPQAVRFANALNLDQGGVALQVLAPQNYGYAAVPTDGAKRSLVYDAPRQAAYAVNVGKESLNRFRYADGRWTLDATSVPSILDAGLSPDGSSLVVTATPGRLHLVDPDTLATTFTLNHAAGFARNLTYVSFGITPTNEGRSWLPSGSDWNELVYFDHRLRSIEARPSQPDLLTSFYGGPWTAGSRDGQRMAVVQSASISPTPPMLIWDSRQGRLLTNPAGLTFSYDIHLSDDGSRVILDGWEVRDGDFGLVGRVPPSAVTGYITLVGLMSPDGRRAYVLGYPEAGLGTQPTTQVPRVFVFDTSAPNTASSQLMLVGSFDLQHWPTCRASAYDCSWRARSAISPDGATLFFAGDAHFVVAPVPQPLRTVSVLLKPVPRSGLTMQRWLPLGR